MFLYFFGVCMSRTVSVLPDPALLPWTRTTRLPGLMMSSCSPNFMANCNRFSTSLSQGLVLESVTCHKHNLCKNFISSRLNEPPRAGSDPVQVSCTLHWAANQNNETLQQQFWSMLTVASQHPMNYKLNDVLKNGICMAGFGKIIQEQWKNSCWPSLRSVTLTYL